MISDNPSVKFELISQMVAQENNQMTVTELCAIAHVSRSGYYRWCGHIRNEVIPKGLVESTCACCTGTRWSL